MFGRNKAPVPISDTDVVSRKEMDDALAEQKKKYVIEAEDVARANKISSDRTDRYHSDRVADLEAKNKVALQTLRHENLDVTQSLRAQRVTALADVDARIEKARIDTRKELEADLVAADAARIDAEARLATYEKMDTKEERDAAAANMSKLIGGVANMLSNFDGSSKVVVEQQG